MILSKKPEDRLLLLPAIFYLLSLHITSLHAESVLFTEKWISDIQSNPEQWIINHTAYPALYLLKKQNRIIELNEKYNYLLKGNNYKDELMCFYKYLTEL